MTVMLQSDMRRLLHESGVPWRIENGTRHLKVFVGNRMAAILPKSNNLRRSTWRAHLNAMSQIKRAIKLEQTGS